VNEERLGPYRIERELGRGGEAVVHLAEDTRLARRVALKVYPPDFGGRAWLQAKIEREVDLTSRLDDPGVCAIHDTGVADGRAYIAMRYVEGEPLAQWLRGPHSLDERIAVVERIARTVHRAHEVGVVHQDLKPRNVMLLPDGQPVVLDFGSAREEEGDGDVFGGTPAYAAPEQVRTDHGAPDRRSDVFALGVILYESLAGERPFAGPNAQGVFRSILEDPPPPLRPRNPAVSKDLETVVATALAKRQDARYQTALDLAEDLRRVRMRTPVSVRRAGMWIRMARWTRRRPTVAGGLAVMVLLLGAGMTASLRLAAENRRALAATRRLDDMRAVPDLVARERDQHWPRTSRGLLAMDAWLQEAEGVLRRRPVYAAAVDAETVAFAGALDSFEATVAAVRERRSEAESLLHRTIDDHRAEWDRVLAAIADEDANPVYGGLRLPPQEGLVPLGRDPHSGLFEFGHPQSGEVPERNPWTHELTVGPDTGFVFVLVPGGSFRMGAVPPGPEHPSGAPNVDPDAHQDEAPVHTVALDAFLLSKYEANEHQWERLGGTLRLPDEPPEHGQHADGSACLINQTASRPTSVGGLGWEEVTARLERLGLTLPTEAQMEYATRAGTSTVWWTGDDADELRWREGVKTGVVLHVDEGDPNPFGFHLLHGGSNELVRDWYGSYERPTRSGDGLRLVEGGTRRLARGGNWQDLRASRSAARTPGGWGGFRPARELERGDYVPTEAATEAAPTRVRPLAPPVRLEAAGLAIDVGRHAAPALADLDGDGRRDLLVGDAAGRLLVYRNLGTESQPRYETYEWFEAGGRQVRVPSACCMGFGPQVVDLDGDGRREILTGSYWPGDLHLFAEDGRGGHEAGRVLEHVREARENAPGHEGDPSPEDLATSPWVADLDADGDLDLLIGNCLGHVDLFPNVGSPTAPDYSAERVPLAAGGRRIRVEGRAAPCVADWDGDGVLDLLVGDGEGSVWLFANEGTPREPSFARGAELIRPDWRRARSLEGAPEGPAMRTKVFATDYDGDGKTDLLVGDTRFVSTPMPSGWHERRSAIEAEREGLLARIAALRAAGVPEQDERTLELLAAWKRCARALHDARQWHAYVWFFRRIDAPLED